MGNKHFGGTKSPVHSKESSGPKKFDVTQISPALLDSEPVDYTRVSFTFPDPIIASLKQRIHQLEEEEMKKKEKLKEKYDEAVYFLNEAIQKKQITIKNDIRYFTAKKLWKLFEPSKVAIPWKDFKKRCRFSLKHDIVYVKQNEEEIVRILNISPHLLRGAKRWLSENGCVLRSKFEQILSYFEPIGFLIDPSSKQEAKIRCGFSLEIIFKTLSLPSFFGPNDVEASEEEFKDSVNGDHRIRFNSKLPKSYTYDYKCSTDKSAKSIRFCRINHQGIDNEVGYEDENKIIRVHDLIELEDELSKNKNLIEKFNIDYSPAKFKELETLDNEEEELLSLLKSPDLKLEHIYDTLVQNGIYYIESKENLEECLCNPEACNHLLKLIGEQAYITLKNRCERIQWSENIGISTASERISSKEGKNKFFTCKEQVTLTKLNSQSYKELYLCEFSDSNYIMEKIDFSHVKEKSEKHNAIHIFKKEIENISHLSHPNIVPLLGCYEERDSIGVLMPPNSLNDLLKGYIINSKFGFSENEIIFLSKEILSGLAYLHSKKLAHCDLRMDNIVLLKNSNGSIRSLQITFLGTSQHLSRTENSIDVFYLSPEVRKKYVSGPNNFINYMKVDVYSFGIILWELMNNVVSPPLNPTLPKKLRTKFCKISPFFDSCMQPDPQKRIASKELLSQLLIY